MSTLKDDHSGTVHTLKDLEANVTEMLAEWEQGRPEPCLDSAVWSAGLLLQAVKRLRELEAPTLETLPPGEAEEYATRTGLAASTQQERVWPVPVTQTGVAAEPPNPEAVITAREASWVKEQRRVMAGSASDVAKLTEIDIKGDLQTWWTDPEAERLVTGWKERLPQLPYAFVKPVQELRDKALALALEVDALMAERDQAVALLKKLEPWDTDLAGCGDAVSYLHCNFCDNEDCAVVAGEKEHVAHCADRKLALKLTGGA